jgi:hypothetical protein
MRRALAVLLLAIFSLGLIPASAFAEDPESKLPPCCRRNGTHLCSLREAAEKAASGPSFRTSACSQYGSITDVKYIVLPAADPFQLTLCGSCSPASTTAVTCIFPRDSRGRSPPALLS